MSAPPPSEPEASAPPGSDTHGSGGRIRRGVAATLLLRVVGTGGQLILVPAFLHFWSQEQYGDWLTLSAAVSYLALLELGMHNYVANRLTQLRAERASEQYRALLHSAWTLALTAWAVGALIAVVVAFSPWLAATKLGNTSPRTMQLAVVFLALQFLTTIPARLVFSLYRTVGEYPLGQVLALVQLSAHLLVTLGALGLGFGIAGVALAQILPSACVALFAAWEIARRHPLTRLGFRHAEPRRWRGLLLPSLAFLGLQLAQGLTIQGSTMVAATLGAASVVTFNTLRTVANLVTQVVAALNSAVWPELTLADAHGEASKVRSLQERSVRAALGLSLCACGVLYAFCREIVEVWTNGKVSAPVPLMLALLAYVAVTTFMNTTGMVLVATNQHERVTVVQLIAAGGGLAGGLALAGKYGLVAIPLCLVFGELVTKPPIILAALERAQSRSWRFVRDAMARPVLFGGLSCAATVLLSAQLTSFAALPRLLIGLPLASVIALAALALTLTTAERAAAVRYVRARIGLSNG